MLKALVSNVFTLKRHELHIPTLIALKTLLLKSTIKCFKEVKLNK